MNQIANNLRNDTFHNDSLYYKNNNYHYNNDNNYNKNIPNSNFQYQQLLLCSEYQDNQKLTGNEKFSNNNLLSNNNNNGMIQDNNHNNSVNFLNACSNTSLNLANTCDMTNSFNIINNSNSINSINNIFNNSNIDYQNNNFFMNNNNLSSTNSYDNNNRNNNNVYIRASFDNTKINNTLNNERGLYEQPHLTSKRNHTLNPGMYRSNKQNDNFAPSANTNDIDSKSKNNNVELNFKVLSNNQASENKQILTNNKDIFSYNSNANMDVDKSMNSINNSYNSNYNDMGNCNSSLVLEFENSLCDLCYEIIQDNEVIYICCCEQLRHFPCFVDYSNKKQKPIDSVCEICQQTPKLFYFTLKKNNENILDNQYLPHEQQESRLLNILPRDLNNCEKSGLIRQRPQNSPILDSKNNSENCNDGATFDTNINNLENYEELCGLAKQLDCGSMSEIISKNLHNTLSCSKDELSRVPLSPLPASLTPYTGKLKRKYLSTINKNFEQSNNTLKQGKP